jgi:cytochrome oxidase assembly protein ShyY1
MTPVRLADTGSALRLFRQGTWARLLLAVAVLSVAFVFLGRWQLHRHEAKVARNAVIEANFNAAPSSIVTVLPTTDARLPPTRQWTPVEVSGVYEPGAQVLIRNRPVDGNFGYEIVVPLRLPSGAALLVDRGWLPPGENFVRPDAVPAPPAGEVTVVARLRPSEPDVAEQGTPAGEAQRIAVPRLAQSAGGPVYTGAYGVLVSEHPAPATAPTPLPKPDEDLGPHLAYAFQWWIGAVSAWGLLVYYALREAGTRHGDADDTTPRRDSTPRRPRRRGPTDEEWEDAVTG